MATFPPITSDRSPPVDLARVRRIHLMGVGGTGMGAFAGLLASRGFEVQGSDEAVYPPMSEMLANWRIPVKLGYQKENLEPAPDLVIVGNVIRRHNPEAAALRELNIPYMSFPQALGEIFLAGRESLVVAGTHGKTTTSAMLAHLLTAAGRDPSALIGGVALNLGGNFRVGAGPQFVVEGDEYDTAYFDKGPKFLHYRPKMAILTSIELDHVDIYRDLPHYESAFARFLALLPEGGYLAVAAESASAVELSGAAPCRVETYGLRSGDLRVRTLSFQAEGARFSVERLGSGLGSFEMPIFGEQNVENALAAIGVALRVGLEVEEIAVGLRTFRGVRRRQQELGRPGGIIVLDDFAHHPTAVRATLAAVRTRFPDERVLALFEPRSNTSRRKIHEEAYARAFHLATEVIVARPHKAAQIPDGERLDPAQLAADIAAQGTPARHLDEVGEMADAVKAWARKGDVVLLMSNGDFGGLGAKLLEVLA
jgi:UDP-N-acetylmuramate: L-alanyl-gamma-D-glutamyl-meso-diaminopimelate ligase